MRKRDELTSIQDVFMRNIGVKSLEECNNWYRRFKDGSYRIDKLAEAAEFAKAFKNRKVRICGDYDCDGVTSTSILYMGLTKYGFTDVSYRIPRRFSEGFGINQIMIDEAHQDNVDLIITCDNGVAQKNVINYAKSLGIAVIVIDHHEPAVEDGVAVLPDADFIIDPNAIPGSADYNGYCGAGLSYRFIRELLAFEASSGMIPYLGLAAIGTIADVMELREENWVIVREGLTYITRYPATSGLGALLRELGLANKITAHDVGFRIGPVINAASRLNDDGAEIALKQLLYNGPEENAMYMARDLIKYNDVRKELKKEAMQKAEQMICENGLEDSVPLIVCLSDIREGILGIVAGNLCEKYRVPAIVLGTTAEGFLKGSARSCGGFNIKKALDECQSLLLRYGGHEEAAGLSLEKENYEAFVSKMISLGSTFERMAEEEVVYDLEINATEIPSVIKEMARFEPFGQGNAPIVFKVNNFVPVPKYGKFISFIGDGTIAKLECKEAQLVMFNVKPELLTPDDLMKTRYTVVGTLGINTYGARSDCQIEAICMEPVTQAPKVTSLAAMLQAIS